MSPFYLLCVALSVAGAVVITIGGMVACAGGGLMVVLGTSWAYCVGKHEGCHGD